MGKDDRQERLRALPAVDDLLVTAALAAALERSPRSLVLEAIRAELASTRRQLQDGVDLATDRQALRELIAQRASARAALMGRPGTARAINATGVILHTGLGRAPLSVAARAAVADAAGYCILEVDPASGERSHREGHVAERLVRLTGAEAATVVNNNAAAVMIVLATLARGGEVIVSRGELIEIGGSFRVPEVMTESGCKLVEVGATNRCHLRDYELAITDRTRALMKVWPSNYRVIGFHKEVPAGELVALGRRAKLPVIEDLGSGALIDLRPHGFPDEPPVRASIEAGVDLVTFSGDKLLGGPQAGLIAGRRDLVEAVRRHPLFRAVRPDKLALAALDATLAATEDAERAARELPVLAMMTEPVATVRARALELASRLEDLLPETVGIEVRDSVGRLGSGALPEHDVPSASVVLAVADPDDCHRRLRLRDVPVFARVKEGRLWLDLRTLYQDSDRFEVAQALQETLAPVANRADQG